MKKDIPSVLLVGINGYGRNYVRALLALRAAGRARVAGVVDPMASASEYLGELTSDGAPVADSVEAFFDGGYSADCACVSSPIGFHAEQTCALLGRGLPVLCEKPLAGSVADAERMLAAEAASGSFAAIGYQWSFSPVMLRVKSDILSGRYGRPVRFRTRVLWPRTFKYYARNNWAGKIADRRGRAVNDSPVNNATAHYLHNMLFLLGDRPETAAEPEKIEAKLLRANPVETFDTCSMRVLTAGGTALFFYTSHAVERAHGPEFEYVFERGVLRCSHGDDGVDRVRAEFADGTAEDYGAVVDEPMRKMFDFLEKVRDPSRPPLPCGIATAMPHLRCVEALRSVPVETVPEDRVRVDVLPDGDRIRVVPGLFETLMQAYDGWRLP